MANAEARIQVGKNRNTGGDQMIGNGREWNPVCPWAWADAQGWLTSRCSGREKIPSQETILSYSMGDSSSFAMSVTDDSDFAYDNEPVSWAWSANLRHSLIINQETVKEMFLRRWDSPPGSVRRFRLARNPRPLGSC